MISRLVIENVRPRAPGGHPAKAVVGRALRVGADVFRDGHDHLCARLRWRHLGEPKWATAPLAPLGNDRYEGTIEPISIGAHELVVEAWTDRFGTWRAGVIAKLEVGAPIDGEVGDGAAILEGRAPQLAKADRRRLLDLAARLRREEPAAAAPALLAEALDPALAEALAALADPADLTSSGPHPLWVDRERALVGAWYELFPRSEGGLAGAAKRLVAVAEMGFDVVYLPPVHPIGRAFRKGADNSLVAGPDDPGSPWAIGGPEGGHTAVHPDLGTMADFDRFVETARSLGMEVALDYALQCSPDHPWLADHPEWFHHRADGTIRHAENPPKKYQDIYPLDLWIEAPGRDQLWRACKGIIDFWIAHGVRIFRVDNPHTKPFPFWEWLISEIQREQPDIVFLAEAFTRPKVMAKLAEIGFSQSYTYFTWRTSKDDLIEYLNEIADSERTDFMRPTFWPNTPDILSGPLRRGEPGVFKMRLALAATMAPSYGIYSGYELAENEPASEENEEYLNSEKYEIKHRDWQAPGSLAPFIARLNDARRRHPALGELSNIRFHRSSTDWILAYSKHTAASPRTVPRLAPDGDDDVVLVVVNLDPRSTREDVLWVEPTALGLPADAPFEAHDELTGATYIWRGAHPYVRLSPEEPVHLLHLRRHPG